MARDFPGRTLTNYEEAEARRRREERKHEYAETSKTRRWEDLGTKARNRILDSTPPEHLPGCTWKYERMDALGPMWNAMPIEERYQRLLVAAELIPETISVGLQLKRYFIQPQRQTKKKARPKIRPSLRFAILKRDGFRCHYCGTPAQETKIQIDHIKPVAAGGETTYENLTAVCFTCNIGKGVNEIEAP